MIVGRKEVRVAASSGVPTLATSTAAAGLASAICAFKFVGEGQWQGASPRGARARVRNGRDSRCFGRREGALRGGEALLLLATPGVLPPLELLLFGALAAATE